jgi:uncharacterized protein YkwD
MVRRATRWQALAAALLLLGSLGAAVEATSPNQYNPDRQECKFLRLVNRYRDGKGKRKLVLTDTLGAAAEHHSEDMAEHNHWSQDHRLSDGTTAEQNIRNHDYDGSGWGENIAAGNATASATFKQWKKSNQHNRNMLDGNFRAIGIARAFDAQSDYGWYWTTTFGNEVDKQVRC